MVERTGTMGTPIERTEGAVRREPLATERVDVFVFGLPFWNATHEEVRGWWEEALRSEDRNGLVLAFANANTLNHVAKSPLFRRALELADVRVNDGLGFRIASRMRGVEPRANLNGSDLVPRLLFESREPVRVFVFGATEDSNAAAAAALERQFPMVRVAGRLHGYVECADAEPIIRAARADVVLVGLGHPRQETFCMERCRSLDAKIVVPVGGLLDFIAGAKPRAPMIMRRRGLEWMYRLAIEPRRMFVRYVIGNPLFLLRSALTASGDRALLKESTK